LSRDNTNYYYDIKFQTASFIEKYMTGCIIRQKNKFLRIKRQKFASLKESEI